MIFIHNAGLGLETEVQDIFLQAKRDNISTGTTVIDKYLPGYQETSDRSDQAELSYPVLLLRITDDTFKVTYNSRWQERTCSKISIDA